MEVSTPKPPAAMPAMVPKPPSTPKGPASAGSSRASSAGSPKSSDVGGVRRGMKKPTPVQKGSKKSKPKTKVVDANGKKVVDTSWKAKVTINLYNTHYPVCKLVKIYSYRKTENYNTIPLCHIPAGIFVLMQACWFFIATSCIWKIGVRSGS